MAEDPAILLPADLADCWRCGLSVASSDAVCPHCAARLVSGRAAADRLDDAHRLQSKSLTVLFWTYALLLLSGLLHAAVLAAGDFYDTNLEQDFDLVPDIRSRLLSHLLVVEVIDTIIIAISWLVWPKAERQPATPLRRRVISWLLSLPVLGGLIALNFGYHWLIRRFVGVPLVTDELFSTVDVLGFVAICLQPAIVEEWYCRRLALDSLRQIMGSHAAVWISATMFGLLHVAMLPSVPYLIIVGAVLAYLRITSGTLLLPIILHMTHNLIVMLLG
jgi:membrane protease YdiL (CAAX protease family)